MERNERDAYAAIERTLGKDAAIVVRDLVELQTAADAILVLRAPGENHPDPYQPNDSDDRGTFAADPIRPGERIIGGRRFYSSRWL